MFWFGINQHKGGVLLTLGSIVHPVKEEESELNGGSHSSLVILCSQEHDANGKTRRWAGC